MRQEVADASKALELDLPYNDKATLPLLRVFFGIKMTLAETVSLIPTGQRSDEKEMYAMLEKEIQLCLLQMQLASEAERTLHEVGFKAKYSEL